MSARFCENCRWWQKDEATQENVGYCYWNPQTANKNGESTCAHHNEPPWWESGKPLDDPDLRARLHDIEKRIRP